MQRIQVHKRKFGFKWGDLFLAVKEYKGNVSFLLNLPHEKLFKREIVRAEIIKHINKKKGLLAFEQGGTGEDELVAVEDD